MSQQQTDDNSDLWLTPRGLELFLRCKRAKENVSVEEPVNSDDDSTELIVPVASAPVIPAESAETAIPEESEPEPESIFELPPSQEAQSNGWVTDEELAKARHEKLFGQAKSEVPASANSVDVIAARMAVVDGSLCELGSTTALPWVTESGAERQQRELLERVGGWSGG